MNIIVAVYADWGIGYNGTQPLVLRADRRRFKELTIGGTVIAGRRTLSDFPGGDPLPGRKNIILTKSGGISDNDVVTVNSLRNLFTKIAGEDTDKLFVIGGQSVYAQLLSYCKQAYVTKIEAAPLSDAFFPCLDSLPDWTLSEGGDTLESDGLRYSFNIYKNAHPKNYGAGE